MISIGGMEQVFLCNQVGERGSVFGAPLLLVVIINFFCIDFTFSYDANFSWFSSFLDLSLQRVDNLYHMYVAALHVRKLRCIVYYVPSTNFSCYFTV